LLPMVGINFKPHIEVNQKAVKMWFGSAWWSGRQWISGGKKEGKKRKRKKEKKKRKKKTTAIRERGS